MLIANELVYAVEEFAQDKMIATVTPKDVIIIHGWQIVNRIIDAAPGNIQKYEL